ncbi:hypothetical protein CAC42_5200 [Sphaceloma murrayae]|uniref:Uncharacterized protein n=1 Tax=Sphaceloma murrayae TaxID=2082308 RepID=A0A2K1QUE1_9PEZI|nr:hypothetical protein CAC42_5200 [Sphaceloma murrayae]
MSNTLTIHSSTEQKLQPNLLPCKVAYNGPVNAETRYWNPKVEEDGTSTAYFRGRKLQGKEVTLPGGYSGVVLQKTDRVVVDMPQHPDQDDDDDLSEQESPPEQIKVIEQIGTFENITVWDHENTPESGQNPYLKGVEEWLKMAGAVSLRYLVTPFVGQH